LTISNETKKSDNNSHREALTLSHEPEIWQYRRRSPSRGRYRSSAATTRTAKTPRSRSARRNSV